MLVKLRGRLGRSTPRSTGRRASKQLLAKDDCRVQRLHSRVAGDLLRGHQFGAARAVRHLEGIDRRWQSRDHRPGRNTLVRFCRWRRENRVALLMIPWGWKDRLDRRNCETGLLVMGRKKAATQFEERRWSLARAENDVSPQIGGFAAEAMGHRRPCWAGRTAVCPCS